MHMLLHLVCRFLLWKKPQCLHGGWFMGLEKWEFLFARNNHNHNWMVWEYGTYELLLPTNFLQKKTKNASLSYKTEREKKKPPIHWKENVNWTVIVKHWTVTMEHWTNTECMLHTATVINQSAHYPVDKWAIKYTLPNHNSTSFLVFVFHFP